MEQIIIDGKVVTTCKECGREIKSLNHICPLKLNLNGEYYG